MKNSEKIRESFIQTLIRTILTSTVIAVILYFVHIFPVGGKGKPALFEMIWLVVLSIVFGGHWLELLFINRIKFALPPNILILYFIRVCYWFLCSIPLFFIAGLICNLLSDIQGLMGKWWAFGLFFIGIELFMHAIMQIRFKKSFYNGVY